MGESASESVGERERVRSKLLVGGGRSALWLWLWLFVRPPPRRNESGSDYLIVGRLCRLPGLWADLVLSVGSVRTMPVWALFELWGPKTHVKQPKLEPFSRKGYKESFLALRQAN